LETPLESPSADTANESLEFLKVLRRNLNKPIERVYVGRRAPNHEFIAVEINLLERDDVWAELALRMDE